MENSNVTTEKQKGFLPLLPKIDKSIGNDPRLGNFDTLTGR